jgi:hypothetical protein
MSQDHFPLDGENRGDSRNRLDGDVMKATWFFSNGRVCKYPHLNREPTAADFEPAENTYLIEIIRRRVYTQ